MLFGQDRKKTGLKSWYSDLSKGQKEALESVSMDMWPAFIHATLESLPNAEAKIAFDKFHVEKYLGGAVDKVRHQENKALMACSREDLKGSKYKWLYNPKNMNRKQKSEFKSLRDSVLKTARGWSVHSPLLPSKK